MRPFRTLALVLIGVGLFIQGAANAAVQPAAPEKSSSHCAEMMPGNPAPTDEDRDGCCGDMQLGCLVSMNCIAPLVAPASNADALAMQLSEENYSVAAVARTVAFVPGPEPPPPQYRS
jgi:hypothetical protein